MEGRLTKLALKGDQRAFAELVELYKDKIYHLAYRMLNNRHEAEDIVQETFCVCIGIWIVMMINRSSPHGFTGLERTSVLIDYVNENQPIHWMLK